MGRYRHRGGRRDGGYGNCCRCGNGKRQSTAAFRTAVSNQPAPAADATAGTATHATAPLAANATTTDAPQPTHTTAVTVIYGPTVNPVTPATAVANPTHPHCKPSNTRSVSASPIVAHIAAPIASAVASTVTSAGSAATSDPGTPDNPKTVAIAAIKPPLHATAASGAIDTAAVATAAYSTFSATATEPTTT